MECLKKDDSTEEKKEVEEVEEEEEARAVLIDRIIARSVRTMLGRLFLSSLTRRGNGRVIWVVGLGQNDFEEKKTGEKGIRSNNDKALYISTCISHEIS